MTEHTDAVWDPARPFHGWHCVLDQGWLTAELVDPSEEPGRLSCFQVISEDYPITLLSQPGYVNQFYDTTWMWMSSSLTMFTSFWKKSTFLGFGKVTPYLTNTHRVLIDHVYHWCPVSGLRRKFCFGWMRFLFAIPRVASEKNQKQGWTATLYPALTIHPWSAPGPSRVPCVQQKATGGWISPGLPAGRCLLNGKCYGLARWATNTGITPECCVLSSTHQTVTSS